MTKLTIIKSCGTGKKSFDGLKCELCGSLKAEVKCDQCNQQMFCSSCDDMFHRHPKRNTHIRKVTFPMLFFTTIKRILQYLLLRLSNFRKFLLNLFNFRKSFETPYVLHVTLFRLYCRQFSCRQTLNRHYRRKAVNQLHHPDERKLE